MFGILKIELKLKDRLLVSYRDLKGDFMRCKNEEGDWLSIFTRKRVNLMNLKKDSIRASARRVPLSRNSAQYSWKTYFELPLKTWHRKWFQAWFHHKVVMAFFHRSKSTVKWTTSALSSHNRQQEISTTWQIKHIQVAGETLTSTCLPMHQAWTPQSKGLRAQQWAKEFKEGDSRIIKMTINTMTTATISILDTQVTWATPTCHRSSPVPISAAANTATVALVNQKQVAVSEIRHGRTNKC